MQGELDEGETENTGNTNSSLCGPFIFGAIDLTEHGAGMFQLEWKGKDEHRRYGKGMSD